MPNLLLIDDDEKLAQSLRLYFARFEMTLDNETSPLRGIERISNSNHDLVILDVMLPEIDGFEACKRIRKTSDIPIIMLTARGEVTDRVVGLELGADDYLPKPFEPRELVARIQNVLKRHRKSSPQTLQWGELRLDLRRKQLYRDDVPVALTAAEFGLLSLLALADGRVLTRDEIMSDLHGIDADIYSRAIDVLISRLRQKLQRPEMIRTVRGSGYQLVAP
jgi:two-component system, OmpR family, response regulator